MNMGTGVNSHDKKSDKETQSSLIRIFKELIMREHNDSEKRNLLSNRQQQKEERKRKQHSSLKSKIDHKSNGSTSSDHTKRHPDKTSSTEQRNTGFVEDNQYANERKESWINWGLRAREKDSAQDNKDDTCSCVSCALKRIVDSEYACIICLLLIFIISIGAACFLVFRSVPIVATESTDKPSTSQVYYDFKTADSERLKRKIDMINENRMKNELSEGVFGKIPYEDLSPAIMNLPSSSDIDLDTNFRDLTNLEDGDNRNSGDMELATFLEPEKLDIQGNDKLREFYKKLVQTDAKIKSLKKINSPESNLYNMAFGTKSPDRSRRSLKLYHYPKKRYDRVRHRRDLYNKDNGIRQLPKQKNRLKRLSEDADKPTGFVIENKKLLIKYKPAGKRKVPKCSHTPKESKDHHHEHEQKHPFYQNSQKLDELLDRFFNKNLPEFMTDPFGLDVIFQQHKNKCKHPKLNENKTKEIGSKEVTELKEEETKTHVIGDSAKTNDDFKVINNFTQIPRPLSNFIPLKNKNSTLIHSLPDFTKIMGLGSTTISAHKFYNHGKENFEKDKQPIVTSSANDFDVLLSISTIAHPEIVKTGKSFPEIPLIDRVPRIRRLMQADGEEEDNLGYEDFKEVLTDDMENQDDVDKKRDRKKRAKEVDNAAIEVPVTDPIINDEEQMRMVSVSKVTKLNPPGVHNPNWKGPMPLYPDELGSMIRHADMNANKPSQPPPTDTIDVENQNNMRKRKHASDVEYVKDYLDNIYDKLVEMAQAYSDYGVLEGKKDNTKNEKNQATDNNSADHRVKLSVDKTFQRRNLLGRMKEGSATPFLYSVKGNNFLNLMNEQNAAIAKTVSNLPSCHASEGIRIEIRPTTESRDDYIPISKVIKSHFKIENDKEIMNSAKSSHTYASHSISTYPDTELLYSPKINFTPLFEPTKKKVQPNNNENDYTSNGLIFAINKGRTLLSTYVKKSDYDDTILGKDEGTFDTDGNSEDTNYISDENYHYEYAKKSSPDLTEIILNKYSDTEKNNYLSHSDKSKMNTLNTQNLYKELAVKTISPLDSGEMLFKSISNKSGIQKDNSKKSMDLNPDEILITIARSEIKPKVLDKSKTEGQILLTFQNPVLGVQNIELKFDSPVLDNISSFGQAAEDCVSTQFNGVAKTPRVFQEISTNILDPYKLNHKVKKRLKRDTITADQKLIKNNEYNHSATLSTNILDKILLLNETDSINNTHLIKNATIRLRNNTIDNNTTVNNYFAMIFDWLKNINGVKMDQNKSHETISGDMINVLLPFNNTLAIYNYNDKSTTTETVHAHRSRMLLSIKDDNLTDKGKNEREYMQVMGANNTNVSGNVNTLDLLSEFNTTYATIPLASVAKNRKNNSSFIENKHTTVTNIPKKYRGVKTKVKRNADDSNLIFWSDLYDDEYGIQTDNLDNVIKDKYFNKQRDFIKKSGRWVQEKFRKLAENLKNNPDSDVVLRKRTPRATRSIGIGQYPKYIIDKILKRDSAVENDNDNDQKSLFKSLGANMIEVCKKAANAVKHIRDIEVKEDSKQGTMATSLMQQLVGLLTELVDYQVQQKSCTKLPPDLRSFLEWLTLPEDHEKFMQDTDLESLMPKSTQSYPADELMDTNDESKNSEHNQNYDEPLPRNEKEQPKPSYLDMMRSVQDLLEQYEMMNDEDKSKMTGVKYYLENQMKFLRSELGSNAYDIYDKSNLFRYKRNLPPRVQTSSKGRGKRKLRKFIKNFGKKHTRTTASFYDGLPVTDMRKNRNERFGLNKKLKQNRAVSKCIKRNLKDVYYHAVAEAKKYTKIGLKKGETADFSTTQNVNLHSFVNN